MAAAKGFTLVEILVVLMVMGILLGMVAASRSPGERESLRVEAERLAQLLDLAVEESRIAGKTIAWTADGSSYRFWLRGADDGWSEIGGADLLRARSLPQGMTFSGLQVEGRGPHAPRRLEIAPGGALLAFTIGLSIGAEHYTVDGSPLGDVRVSSGKAGIHGDMAPQ